jgi:hypothetical protein
MAKWKVENEMNDEDGDRRVMKSTGKASAGAGNVVSPPKGPAYSGGQGKGDYSTGKGFGEKYSSPGEQPFSGRAYSGGQAAGTKGFSSNEKFKP